MKLTTKLILAFLLVSLFSTGIIVVFTRVATNREFDKFVNDKYQADLVDATCRLLSGTSNLGWHRKIIQPRS